MTAPAPAGATPTTIRAAGRDTTAAASGELCHRYAATTGGRVSARTARKALAVAVHPDVAAYAAYCEITDPAHIAYMQRQYDAGHLLAEAREDDGPAIWRTIGRRSAPADPQGDRIARRLSAA